MRPLTIIVDGHASVFVVVVVVTPPSGSVINAVLEPVSVRLTLMMVRGMYEITRQIVLSGAVSFIRFNQPIVYAGNMGNIGGMGTAHRTATGVCHNQTDQISFVQMPRPKVFGY